MANNTRKSPGTPTRAAWTHLKSTRRLAVALPATALLAAGSLMAFNPATPATADALPTDPVIAAVGDIACDPTSGNFKGGLGTSTYCQQMATSDLALGIPNVAAVLPVGDLQYEDNALSKYYQSYDPSWGRLRSISKPVPGNHEYIQAGASAYFTYWGAQAGDPTKGYYSYDLGAWHIVALNSNCSQVGGCTANSPQVTWLKADLAAHPTMCTLAYWHHPLFSSGSHGNNPSVAPMWDALSAAGAEVVLSGHDHNYQRFAPQTSAAIADPVKGIRQFVVGMGGKDHYALSTQQANSEATNADTSGVLQMTLHADSYDWKFLPVPGKSFSDSGTTMCHGTTSNADTTAPTAPTSLKAVASGSRSVALSWTASSDNTAVAGYKVLRAGVQIGTSSGTSYTDTTVSPGSTVSYQVTAYDAAGNVSAASSSVTVAVPTDPTDTTPPSEPSGLRTTDVQAARVSLAWDGSTDDSGVASYTVLRNSVVIGTSTTTSFVDTTVGPVNSYTYSVSAVDVAGNKSGASSALTVQTPEAPAAPTTLTATPSDDAYVRSDKTASNYGAAQTLQVDTSPADKRTYMRFRVSGVSGRQVLSAKLTLNAVDGGGGGEFHVVKDTAWTEGTITWNNKPAHEAAVIAKLGKVSTNQSVTVDLTSVVTGDGVYSFDILGTSSDGADYTSDEGGTTGAKLVLSVAGS